MSDPPTPPPPPSPAPTFVYHFYVFHCALVLHIYMMYACAASPSNSTTGFLCGSCVSGTGVTSLLNRCEACDTANATLIVGLGKFL